MTRLYCPACDADVPVQGGRRVRYATHLNADEVECEASRTSRGNGERIAEHKVLDAAERWEDVIDGGPRDRQEAEGELSRAVRARARLAESLDLLFAARRGGR